MKYLDEYRDAATLKKILAALEKIVTRPWVIMEVCGGQTHAIVRSGIDQVLPDGIELVHGPGCPVCVTPIQTIDMALAIASRPEVIFCSFGDMLRVPGSEKDLFAVKSEGGDVRMVYSPLEAVELARKNPDREVVFFAIGFETTAPGNALAILQAAREGLRNFSVLASHVLVPPALKTLLASPENRVNGYLAAGHVCTVMGLKEYYDIAREFKVPIVAAGLEPVDLLEGIYMVVKQLEEGTNEVANQYSRSVRRAGNEHAQKAMFQVFEIDDQQWRGIGMLPKSGLAINKEYAAFDAQRKFPVGNHHAEESEKCVSGLVLQGLLKPFECEAFGRECVPERPLGATMVSSEGACAAYFKYHRMTEAKQ